MALQAVNFSDFSGGITDQYLDAAPNTGAVMDNWLISVTRKLYVRPGSRVFDLGAAQVVGGAVRINGLINYNNDQALIAASGRFLFKHTATGWTEILGPGGSAYRAFPAGDGTTYVSHTQGDQQVIVTLATPTGEEPQKIILNGSTMTVLQAGLPEVPEPAIGGVASGTNSYIYGFAYAHTYTSSGRTFLDVGPITQIEKVNVKAPNEDSFEISALQHLSAVAPGKNYNFTNTKIHIYRTTAGGVDLYKVTEVSPGTASYTDTMSDAALVDRELAYTAGGVLDNDPPPRSRFVHIANNTCYYANENWLRKSIAGDYDSCPIDLFVEFPGTVTALSSVGGIPLVWTERGLFRVDGQFDELGRGGMVATRVDETVDCIAPGSVVQVREGVFFWGRDGIHFTDGYRVQRITSELKDTYLGLVSTSAQVSTITATYDSQGQRIYWAARSESSSTDNDVLYVLDLRYGVRAQSTFTTWSGGDSFVPTALTVYGGALLRGDKRGYVLKHQEQYAGDTRIDTGAAVANWVLEPIIYRYRSSATSFGTQYLRKFTPKALFTFKSETNYAVEPRSISDDSDFVVPMAPIKVEQGYPWSDPALSWGAIGLTWGDVPTAIETVRRFPGRELRCSFKQVEITNAFTEMADSDTYAVATVNAVNKTLWINPATGYSFPENIVGSWVSLGSDNYTNRFKITSRPSSSTIVFADPTDKITASGLTAWKIEGYPPQERVTLHAYQIYFDVFSNSFEAYSPAQGAVGAKP